VISDRKAGGILTELKGETDRVDFVVLGIGINVNTPKSALPRGGTSLKSESKATSDFSRVEFARALLEELEREYVKFRNDGFAALVNELKSLSCTIGRHVTVSASSGRKHSGKAVDIDKNGALVVRLEDGELMSFLSGDVTLVR
jgi:BirA family biotin operon repressor/biotin-[acetyl-CoA-carboxylase] ligase